MLLEMHVQNFGLMEDIRLEFSEGLTVFTGETGAGKSMLIDALGVLLGGRVSAEMIRHGEGQARVEGVFSSLTEPLQERLADAGYAAEDDQLFLSREVNASGRNLCRVQGRTIPLSLYRSLCEGLADIHGQMEHQSLLKSETHRELVDALGGAEGKGLSAEVASAAREYRAMAARERELSRLEGERQRRLDILDYQLAEIDQISPRPGEEEELRAERKRLSHGEKIASLVQEAYEVLYIGAQRTPSAYDLLARAKRALSELARLDPACSGLLEPVEAAYYAVEDLGEQVRRYQEGFDLEPKRLEVIEERLAELHRLSKYGGSIEKVLNEREQMSAEREQLTHLEDEQCQIAAAKEKARLRYQEFSQRLTLKRQEEAQRLEKELALELTDLGLEKSRLEVRFVSVADPDPRGAEQIEFYFSANQGEPPKPLAKTASGGEMARVMLALKSMLAGVEQMGTFVFDEVDSGVGGRTIQKVGEKLRKIAQGKQVFCITHAPIVASFADEHYGIVKEVKAGRTRTQVERLNSEARIDELARMLGGEGDISQRHARELWEKNWKQGVS